MILSRNKNLDDDRKETLDQLMKQNKTLYSAYLLKEQLFDIFDEDDSDYALKRLKRWMKNVMQTSFEKMKDCVKMIEKYFYGVQSYFKNKITNAASEGFNNKINVIKRRAYGFRDLEYFMLKILQSCGWRSS